MRASTTRQQVRRVLIVTLILNFGVAFGKIALGLLTGALSITADGFHSLIDGSSNIVALIANRIADRPPDDNHPYGHRRFETVAALAIGGMLLLTAWEIVNSAVGRLRGGNETPQITPLAFGVMMATLGINLFVTWYETREGRRLNSELLLADAANTRTDIFVSLSVLVSMALVALFGWVSVDTLAALVIVALILHAAWQVLRQTGSVLVDTAPYGPERLAEIVQEIPSVQSVLRARSRGPLDAAQIDIDVQVAPETTADHAEAIAGAIRDRLTSALEGVAEVEVHFAPHSNGDQDYALAARACADALGLATHEVYVGESNSPVNGDPSGHGKVLELHVEVPAGQTLDEAHERVSRLERDIRQKLPGVTEVLTHIEPAMPAEPVAGDSALLAHSEQLETQAQVLLDAEFPDLDWHDLRVRPYPGGFILTMHVTLPPRITIESAHTIAESAETLLRTRLAELDRVTIHTEPPDSED